MKRLSRDDFMHYRFLSGLSVSPDGGKAAFVVNRCDRETDGYRSHIHLLDPVSGRTKQLTSGGRERTFLWLDQRRILFPDGTGGADRTTYRGIPVDGGESLAYMDVPLKVLKLRHLGGDRFLALARYTRDREGPHVGPGDHMLDEIPFWADGVGFTSGVRSRLYLFDRASGEVTPVSGDREQVHCFDVYGEKIVYAAFNIEGKQKTCSAISVYEHGRARTLLADDRFRVRHCGFVGGEIVFAGSEMARYGVGENPWFYTLSEAGVVQLLFRYDRGLVNAVTTDCKYGGGVTVGTRGDALYFTSTEGGNGVLRKVTLDGGVETVTGREGSVDCFDLLGDDILFIGMREFCLQEIYLLSGGRETRLTGLNSDILADKALSPPQRLDIVNDGTTIEGYVIPPVDFDPDSRYPAILTIHGGPRIAYGPVFFHEFQHWAAEGYFVFYCNPRGSDGRGNEFSDLRGRYGTVDYDDIMRFTDAVLERYPQIDAARLGVTGGSYGGFMTNWIIGHTDRFRCAASLRGISSWQTFFATSDCGYEFVADQQQATPWTDNQKLWDQSPLQYADRVKTPTLFLHGDRDHRCWLVEGLQMFTALKYHGVETRLWVFGGASHEMSRSGKPSQRSKRLEVLGQWFDRHLKEEKA